MVQIQRDITIFALSVLVSIILWMYSPPPFTPILIFYGNEGQYITIQNLGPKQVTDITVEFDPEHKQVINKINYTRLSGEIITNYSNKEQSIFHISRMYANDRAFFYVDSHNNQKIDLIVRSNEAKGQSATEYYGRVLQILQYIFIVMVAFLGYQIFKFIKKKIA